MSTLTISTPVRPVSPFFVPSLVIVAIAAWTASLAVGALSTPDPMVHKLGLVFHILSLIVSFGAILVLDWVGFLWLSGRRMLHETNRLEAAAPPLIWGGMAGLLATGAMIEPDITSQLTQLKLVAVLGLMLNGVLLAPLSRRLHSMPRGTTFAAMGPAGRTRMLTQ
jgi:hypothetical protein